MFKTVILLIAFMTTAIAADFDVHFSGANLDQELITNFEGFKAHVQGSSYYQPSLNTTPLVDFVMLLTNKSADRNVRYALDYLIKTGGPWQKNRKKATEQEKVYLSAAAEIIAEQDPTCHNKQYQANRRFAPGSAEETHLNKILEIQRRFIGEVHSNPLRGPLVLPPAAADIPDPLKPDVNKGWELFKGLLRDPNLFKEPSGKSNPTPKASWLNDVESLGFLIGAVPDIRGQYIDGLWAQSNPWMEAQHNYVQWWFPIDTVGSGDGVNAPRFLDSTNTILQNNDAVRTYAQQMMRVSFARKASFWGQRVVNNGDGTLRLEKLAVIHGEKDWEENWIYESHNYLRMTRFLHSLRFLGLIPERNALFEYLKSVSVKDARVRGSVKFWDGATPDLKPISKHLLSLGL